MFLLSKLLPLFILPLGVSLICLVWGATRRRPRFVWAGVLILLVSTNPLVGHYAMRSAEGWAVRRAVSEVATADAIVVLSAGRVTAPGPDKTSEWGDANRFFGGVQLLRAGKAPLLVFTGAWTSFEPDALQEGVVLAKYAQDFGVPATQIAVTGIVANTADEAREVTKTLAGRGITSPRVLLVTSAFHMPRARQIFEQAGLSVDPFPVDFRFSADSAITVLDFVPSVGALGQTQTALRELYGRGYYWLRAL